MGWYSDNDALEDFTDSDGEFDRREKRVWKQMSQKLNREHDLYRSYLRVWKVNGFSEHWITKREPDIAQCFLDRTGAEPGIRAVDFLAEGTPSRDSKSNSDSARSADATSNSDNGIEIQKQHQVSTRSQPFLNAVNFL